VQLESTADSSARRVGPLKPFCGYMEPRELILLYHEKPSLLPKFEKKCALWSSSAFAYLRALLWSLQHPNQCEVRPRKGFKSTGVGRPGGGS